MTNGRRREKPPETVEAPRRLVTVDIKLSMEYKNWPDFQASWNSQYADYLREFAAIESATLTIPPTGEPDIIQLDT